MAASLWSVVLLPLQKLCQCAAQALGRRAIGIELSSEYLEIARRRLGQGSLFLEEAEEEEAEETE